MNSQLDQLESIDNKQWRDFTTDALMRRDVLFDLGPYARQVLLRNQAIAYKDVNQPFEDLAKQLLVIRTGECSGRFELQVSQRLMVESMGFDSQAI